MAAQVFDRITIEPAKLNGQPCIRGLRLTVRRVLEALSTYGSRDELRADYPELDDEDIRQAIARETQLAAGALITVQHGRLRVRSLPVAPPLR
jgi:uncharacterized protein (DUF433 family)